MAANQRQHAAFSFAKWAFVVLIVSDLQCADLSVPKHSRVGSSVSMMGPELKLRVPSLAFVGRPRSLASACLLQRVRGGTQDAHVKNMDSTAMEEEDDLESDVASSGAEV